jgi:hypothetical protein
MRSDILFKLSSHGAQQRRNLKILHGFTDGVNIDREFTNYYKPLIAIYR